MVYNRRSDVSAARFEIANLPQNSLNFLRGKLRGTALLVVYVRGRDWELLIFLRYRRTSVKSTTPNLDQSLSFIFRQKFNIPFA